MRATVLTPLLLLGWSLQAIGQSPAPSSGEKPALEAESPVASANELKLVVALFRHGVRAPLPNFGPDKAKVYSRRDWPSLEEWKIPKTIPKEKGWGALTIHGWDLATALGNYYAQWYKKKDGWPEGFRVYLWADTDERTIATANALNQGFQQRGISDVTVNSSQSGGDPLFHPFKAQCGTPDAKRLATTVDDINNRRKQVAENLKPSFEDLYGVLGSEKLKTVVDTVTVCKNGNDPSKNCESPITWAGPVNTPPPTATTATATATATASPHPGQFPYASSASEAFLLEYANNMPATLVGWGMVDGDTNLGSMLQLHEAYFQLTEREPYIAQIQGSNLIREIRDLLTRTAQPLQQIVKCLRADRASQFVGLVGHDTNIAGVGELLHLTWEFADSHLPPGEHLPKDTLKLPRNDALPAGALVFELRQRAGQYIVRIEYVAQSLLQMRGDPQRPPDAPFRFKLNCQDEGGTFLYPCEMPLEKFKKVVTKALGQDNPFLSRCGAGGEQVCR